MPLPSYPDTPTQRFLESRSACTPARDWVEDRDLATAWRESPNGEWMMWLLVETWGNATPQLEDLRCGYRKATRLLSHALNVASLIGGSTLAEASSVYWRGLSTAQGTYADNIRTLHPECPISLPEVS